MGRGPCLAAGGGLGLFAPRDRARTPRAARSRSPCCRSRTWAPIHRLDHLRLALPGRGRDDAVLHPDPGDPPLRFDTEVCEGGRGPPGRRARTPCRRRPDRPLPERERPAPGHAGGRRHGEQPANLARHDERRRRRPDRTARSDLGPSANGALPASRRVGRQPRRRRPVPGTRKPTTCTSAARPSRATPSPIRRASTMLERAVRLDPDFAPAWAALGNRYYYVGGAGSGTAYAQSRAAIDRAISLDPNLSQALEYSIVLETEGGRLAEADAARPGASSPASGRRACPLCAGLRPALRRPARGVGASLRRGPGRRSAESRVPILRHPVRAARRPARRRAPTSTSTA